MENKNAIKNIEIGTSVQIIDNDNQTIYIGQIVHGFGTRKNNVWINFVGERPYILGFSIKTGKTFGKNNFYKNFQVIG
jgi:hypothetical protein